MTSDLPRKKYPWLLLPCLNRVREFDAKLLFAAVAAERGWGTIVGYKEFVKYNVFDVAGVLLEMSLKTSKLAWHASLGRKICAWDEEGLVFSSADHYCQHRVPDPTLNRIEMAFLWGHNQKEAIQTCAKGIDHKLQVTGNPRFDMLRPELRSFYAEDVQRILEQHGNYILVNTNFAFVNNLLGRTYNLGKLKEKGTIVSSSEEQDQLAREHYEDSILQAFAAMLPVLSSSFPDYTIIVRPHPSENFDTWRAHANALPNVRVVHEGDVVPWLLAARASVHNGCTTGIQAYLLGRPTVSYMPVTSQAYDKDLPNSLSLKVTQVDELVRTLREILSGNYSAPTEQARELKRIADHHIEGMSGAWASERVMDAMGTLKVRPQALKYNVRRDAAAEPAAPSEDGSLSDRLKYLHQTFPPLDMADVRKSLDRLRHATGRFSRVEVSQTGEQHVCVYPSEA